MSRDSLMAVFTVCAVAWFCGGCGPRERPVTTPVTDRWESPAPPAEADRSGERGHGPGPTPISATLPAEFAASAPAAVSPPIAFVNGSPIARERFVDTLIASHGLQMLEQLILLAAAQQRAAEMSLSITEADLAAAREEALARVATPVGDPQGPPLDPEATRRLLEGFLAAKNISPQEWDCRIRQRAYLHKIAEAELGATPVTDERLRHEYELAYSEKVQVRLIRVSSLGAASRVRSLLAAGKDFELVARQTSEDEFTASNGGLTRPFTRDDPGVTPLLREAAFALKVGEVSETIRDDAGGHFIMRLERRFPASDVGFENVDRDKLRRRLLDRLVAQRQRDLEAELFQAAAVDIRDEELERQFRDKHRQPGR